MKMNHFLYVVLGLSFSAAGPAFGWGERGHHVICEVATKLVKNPELRKFLVSRREAVGHMCNLPDISWKNQGNIASSGDAAHFIDPENLDLKVSNVPTNFTDILAQFEGKTSEKLGRPIVVAKDLGSLWWRAQQFFDAAVVDGKNAVTFASQVGTAQEAPKPPKRDPAATLALTDLDATTQAIYKMYQNMGLLGHFVGDSSQPLHVTANYDGWENGHGGLHSYYETAVVNEMSEFLPAQIYAAAKLSIIRYNSDPVKAMKQLSEIVNSQRGLLFALDNVVTPSKIESGAKIPAKRVDAGQSVKAFGPMIVFQMAASAQLLAHMWDTILLESGNVGVDKYKSYLYPLDVKFEPLNYTQSSEVPTP